MTTLLSQRTQDQVTREAACRLFNAAATLQKMMKLTEKQIRDLIFPVGFYHTKAKRIKDICSLLIEKYHGKIPETREKLLSLKGVGRKTANLVLAAAFNKDVICVDTHVHRISNRLGFVKTNHPFETEIALMRAVPKPYWKKINYILVAFGQTICRPVKPACRKCPVKEDCPSVKMMLSSLNAMNITGD